MEIVEHTAALGDFLGLTFRAADGVRELTPKGATWLREWWRMKLKEPAMTVPLYMPQHTCREGDDPRRAGYCACGLRMPEQPTDRLRNLDLEREFTHDAAKGIANAEPLIEFAETRAISLSRKYVSDPMRVLLGRKRLRDMREELADCRNHGVWWQEENLGVDEDRDHLVRMAQRHVAIAYDLLLKADQR